MSGDVHILGAVTVGAKFCVMVPTVCGSSEWYLLHVTLLAPRVLRWLLLFVKICAPMGVNHSSGTLYRGPEIIQSKKSLTTIHHGFYSSCDSLVML